MERRVLLAELADLGRGHVDVIGLRHRLVDRVQRCDFGPSLLERRDLSAGQRRQTRRLDQASFAVDRLAGLAGSVLGAGAEQVEGQRALGVVPLASDVGYPGQACPAADHPVAPLRGPFEEVDDFARRVGELLAEFLGFELAVIVPEELGAEDGAVALPSFDASDMVDPERKDDDLIDEPGVVEALRFEVEIPLAGAIIDGLGVLGDCAGSPRRCRS